MTLHKKLNAIWCHKYAPVYQSDGEEDAKKDSEAALWGTKHSSVATQEDLLSNYHSKCKATRRLIKRNLLEALTSPSAYVREFAKLIAKEDK